MSEKIDPADTGRAQAFQLWMKAPMPIVYTVKIRGNGDVVCEEEYQEIS